MSARAASSVTESETRVFDRPAQAAPFTATGPGRPTGPAYVAPAFSQPPDAQYSPSLPAKKSKAPLVIALVLGSVVVLAIIAFGLLFAIVSRVKVNSSRTLPQPPATSQEPPNPPPAAGSETQKISRDLYYPGAKVTMDVTSSDDGQIVQLSTPDSREKVINWYVEKLAPEKKVILPIGPAIISGKDATAVITESDDRTQIILKTVSSR